MTGASGSADGRAGGGAFDRVARARSARPEDAAALYRDWAAHYDADLVEVLGITGSSRIAELLAEHLADRAASVVDLGCGTGLVGTRLRELGFLTVDGVDISPEMLAVATAKGCYRRTVVGDLADVAALPRGPYSASVSAGTFTTGHVGPGVVPGLLALHSPSAWLAWVIAAPVWDSFREVLDANGVDTVRADLEPIRRGGEPESVMFVGRLPG